MGKEPAKFDPSLRPVPLLPADLLRSITDRALGGCSDSQESLGDFYRTGMVGVTPERAKAIRWYRLAAASGSARAEHWLQELETGALRSFDTELLRTWSEQVCRLAPCNAREAAAALGLEGKLVEYAFGFTTVEPPPAGATKLSVVKAPDGIGRLDLLLAGPGLTRAQLEAALGPGSDLPRERWDQPHELAFRRTVSGCEFSCTVLAIFVDEPTAISVTTEVLLRRDPI